jgi:hypothetical protein
VRFAADPKRCTNITLPDRRSRNRPLDKTCGGIHLPPALTRTTKPLLLHEKAGLTLDLKSRG